MNQEENEYSRNHSSSSDCESGIAERFGWKPLRHNERLLPPQWPALNKFTISRTAPGTPAGNWRLNAYAE
jgi:hypothetical protein